MDAYRLTEDSEVDVRLYSLADQFLSQLRQQPRLRTEDFAREHPALEAELLELLPGLLMAEQLRAESDRGDDHESDRENDRLTPGVIGPFRLLRTIGSGGMGTVYEASHRSLTRRTAIKILNPDVAGSQALKRRLLSEADLAARIHHPHVVPVLDFCEDNRLSYISMLYVDGESVDRILHRHWNTVRGGSQRMEPSGRDEGLLMPGRDFRKIARLGAQAASALAHAHSQGTIHRDIKPGNLILDHHGKTWVTDFGLATNEQGGTECDLGVVGTPRYIAPEQRRGTADERSDIYSLGVTLYELASGTRAFADCETDLRQSPMLPLPPILTVNSSIPRPLAEIIDVACQPLPENRYPSARELQTVLSRFAHSGVSGDRRQRHRRKHHALLRPHRLLTLTVILCATAIVVAMLSRGAWIDTGQQTRWFLNTQPVVLTHPPDRSDTVPPASPTVPADQDER
ncbi:MAG: serine/threonine protein kinase [Planctomycetaceae bacterium]|nr:serine/threonine protein kinase [Planctomycetaceae bacterium]